MKNQLTVIKPFRHSQKPSLVANMFQQNDVNVQTPPTIRSIHQSYDFVGPLEFRKKLLSRNIEPTDSKEKNNRIDPIQLNQTSISKNFFRSTINRDTVLSSLHRQQQIQITRQPRNLQRYKQYKEIWEKKKDAIRSQIKKKSPILMDSHIKSLYVHPNEDKVNVINDYIVHYWEMSLRNHHPILQRHIKGHNFDPVDKEKLLQLRQGIKRIQQSIPALPIQKLNRFKRQGFSVSGRNKIKREAQSSQHSTTRYSIPTTTKLQQEEVYKIDYEGNKKWMGTQNL